MTSPPPLDWDAILAGEPTTDDAQAGNGKVSTERSTGRMDRQSNHGKARTVPDDDTTEPRDMAAERAALGAALLQPALVPELAGIIRDDDWYHPAHAAIWATITDLHARGDPVDLHTVGLAVGTDRTLASLGGPIYVSDLTNAIPTVSSATYYARIIADRAVERRTVELGTWIVQAGRNGTDRPLIQDRIEKHLADHNPADNGATSSWAPVDLTDALAGTEDDNRPTLMPRSDGNHLLYPGAVHMLSGEPTSGKTWIALHAIKHELNQGNSVALIDFEDRAPRVVARLLLIGARPEHIRDHLRYVRPYSALDTTGKAALSRAVTGTTLTVADGVTEAMTLHGLDLSSNPDVAKFYELLPRWVANHGSTVLLIDHVVKDSEKQGRWSIGGQHKVAGIDGAAYTVKNVEPLGRGKRGWSRVIISKDRHGHVEEIALGKTAAEFHLDSTRDDTTTATLDPPSAMPTTESGDMRPTYLMERVSRWLEVNPGASVRAVRAAVPGKSQYVIKALQQLITEGLVDTEPGPRGATYHRVTTPFRQDGETNDDHTY